MNTRGSALLLGAAAWCCLRTFQRRWARARSPASLSIPPTSRPALSRRLRSGALASAATSQSFSAMATSSLLWASRSHSLRHSTTSIRRGAYQVVGASLHGSGQHLHWQGQQNGADSCGPEPDDHVDVHLGLFLLVGCHAWRADHSTGGEFRRSARTGVDSFERLSRQCQRSSAVGYSEVLARHLRGGDCS